MKNPVIIYHKHCQDGFGSAWAAYRKFGAEAEYIPFQYGDQVDDALKSKLAGKDVYMCDVVLDTREAVIELQNICNLTVLDHHQTAERIADLPNVILDKSRSGAGITWDYFHSPETRPRLINYIEDRDLFKKELPHNEEITSYLFAHHQDFKSFQKLADQLDSDKGFEQAVETGKILLQSDKIKIDFICKTAYKVNISGYEVPCVNAQSFISDVASKLSINNPFAVAWYRKSDGTFKHSLRRDNFTSQVNLAKIAESFGGGGHAGAAAFVTDKPLPGIVE